MNQLYRALHMPPLRLVRKLMGHKEIYTIGWRRFVPGKSLPETGAGHRHCIAAPPANRECILMKS